MLCRGLVLLFHMGLGLFPLTSPVIQMHRSQFSSLNVLHAIHTEIYLFVSLFLATKQRALSLAHNYTVS